LGGIGKTQIAAEYAYRYRSQYDTVLWLRATAEQFAPDILRIATLLHLPAARKPQEPSQLVRAIARWLREHARWLLILDNVQEAIALDDLLAAAGTGHIMLTTRVKAIADLVSTLELDEMSPEEGALLLLRRAKIIPSDATLDTAADLDRILALALSHVMGGLPLALDLAGAYIAENAYTLACYQAEYEQRRAELLARLLSSLARCYWFQGKLPEAEPLFKEALVLLEQALGPDDLDLANTVVWLAATYREWGRYEEAEPLYQRALAIRERHLEPGHPTIAFTLDGFAAFYLRRSQLAPALDLRQRALTMLEHALGPDHPETAQCLVGLADTYTQLALLVHYRSLTTQRSNRP